MTLLASGLSSSIADEELLARFVVQSSWFAKTTRRVKHQAFLPAPDNDTSVFRTEREPTDAFWAGGEAELNGRPVYGAAIVAAKIVRKEGLDVLAEEPPPRHANIRGWPLNADDPIEQKARRKAIAQALSEEASLWLRSEPNDLPDAEREA